MSFTGRSETFLQKVLPNNDFMPAIKMGDFQEQFRVSTSYSQNMVEDCLYTAMFEINKRCQKQQSIWQQDGITELVQVPDQPQEGYLTRLYVAAVCNWAMAEIQRRFVNVTTRKISDVTGKFAETNERSYYRRADQHVRQLLGQPSISCELL